MTDTRNTEHFFPLSITHDSIRWGSADVAALLHVFRVMLDKNVSDKTCHHKGRVWAYISYENLTDQMPWLMVDDVQKICSRLKKLHYLLIDGPYGKSADPHSNIFKFSLNDPAYQVPFVTNKQPG